MKLLGPTLLLILAACSGAQNDTDPTMESTMEDARLFVEGADANGDGGVSREELSHVLETNFSQVIPATFLEDSFSGYDLDGDGAITVEEMQNVVREVWAEQDRQTGS